MTTHVELHVDVDVPAQVAWDALTDWPTQGEWMLGTTVWVTHGDGRSIGSTLAAYTGVRPLGFLDTMTITVWDPPLRCDVVHTGWLVRGTGTMAVAPLGPDRCRVTWAEDLDIPGGLPGRLGFAIARPAFLAGVRRSLEQFARLLETRPSTSA